MLIFFPVLLLFLNNFFFLIYLIVHEQANEKLIITTSRRPRNWINPLICLFVFSIFLQLHFPTSTFCNQGLVCTGRDFIKNINCRMVISQFHLKLLCLCIGLASNKLVAGENLLVRILETGWLQDKWDCDFGALFEWMHRQNITLIVAEKYAEEIQGRTLRLQGKHHPKSLENHKSHVRYIFRK